MGRIFFLRVRSVNIGDRKYVRGLYYSNAVLDLSSPWIQRLKLYRYPMDCDYIFSCVSQAKLDMKPLKVKRCI